MTAPRPRPTTGRAAPPGPDDLPSGAARDASAERAEAAVLIRGVAKRFERHVAVDGLSLTVPRGSVYGLLGPNGAGKTTTIRMILNIIAPDEGEISVLGRPVATSDVTDRIGYLPEERGLYKKMQVRQVLRFLAELKGVPARVADGRINAWLERLGLATEMKDWGSAKVDELSRGMQQKVQFIGALVHEPELVILDEPFSGLDPINAQALKDTVVELKRSGKTVIFSTHLMENAERMCDAVCIISNGVKVLDGTVTAVKADYGNQRVAVALDGRARRPGGRPLDDRPGSASRDRARSGRGPADAAPPTRRRGRGGGAVRARAAVAARDLPGQGRRRRHRAGDERSWLSSGWCSNASTWSGCGRAGSSSRRSSGR